MPLTRYQIRNEYSLADPELYRAADKDDPEALLEGVAMAGLVGVLRQLGDLAEFAAEVFHDLHVEVMATAARGHGLTLRVQQLEAEFPSIEKALLSQTSHSLFLHSSGVDWHPNLRLSQSLITQGDLPRFVMDSFEECRGPPRLFLLDKFDIAGAGACLKRYTDPSFFKAEFLTSEAAKEELKREKKVRRIKKGSRWRTGENPEATASHFKLHQLLLQERCQSQNNVHTHHVKLKRRHYNNSLVNSTSGKSLMEKFLYSHSPDSPDKKIVRGSSVIKSSLIMRSSTSRLVPEREIHNESPADELVTRDRIPMPAQSREEDRLKASFYESGVNVIEERNSNKLLESALETESENDPSNYYKVEDKKELVVNARGDTEASGEGFHSDDGNSEIDNYADALTTMDSELETDTETKLKNERSFKFDKCVNVKNEEQKELQAQFSDSSQSMGSPMESEDRNGSPEKGRFSPSSAETFSSSAENIPSDSDLVLKAHPRNVSQNVDISSKEDRNGSPEKGRFSPFSTEAFSNSAKNIPSDSDLVPKAHPCIVSQNVDISSKEASEVRNASVTNSPCDVSQNYNISSQNVLEIRNASVTSSPEGVPNGSCDEVSEITNNSSIFKGRDSNSGGTNSASVVSTSSPGVSLSEDQLLHPNSFRIACDVLDSVDGKLSTTSENDLSCMANVSEAPTQSRHDFVCVGTHKRKNGGILDGENLDASDISIHRSEILSPSQKEKDVTYDTEETHSVGVADDSHNENQLDGKIDSPDSVLLNTEVELYGLAEKDLEPRYGTRWDSGFRPGSPTNGDLNGLRPDGTVVVKETLPSGEISEYLTSVECCPETDDSRVRKHSKSTDQEALSLELDMAGIAGNPVVEGSCNKLESSMLDCLGSAKEGSCSNRESNMLDYEMKDGYAPERVHFNSIFERNSDMSIELPFTSDSTKSASAAEPPSQVTDLKGVVGAVVYCSPSGSSNADVNQDNLEIREASSAYTFIKSNDEKEEEKQSVSSEYDIKLCNLPNNNSSSPKFLDAANDPLMVECTQTHLDFTEGTELSLKESDVKEVPKQLSRNANVTEPLLLSTNSFEAVCLEGGQEFYAREDHLSYMQQNEESTVSPHHKYELAKSPDQMYSDGCSIAPSKSSSMEFLIKPSNLNLSPLTIHELDSSETSVSPSQLMCQGSGLHLNASNQQLLHPLPDRLILDMPLSDKNVEEMPPLPPLPPMQWRVGKLRHDFPTSVGESSLASFSPFSSQSSETTGWIAPKGFPTFRGDFANPSLFLEHPSAEAKNPQHSVQMLRSEVVQPCMSPSASVLPAVQYQNVQVAHPTFEPTVRKPLNPFLPLPEANLEHGSSRSAVEMSEQTILEPFTTASTTEELNTSVSLTSLEGLEQPLDPLAPIKHKEDDGVHQTFTQTSTIEESSNQCLSLTVQEELEQSVDSLAPIPIQYREDDKLHQTFLDSEPQALNTTPATESEKHEHDSQTLEGELKWRSNSSAFIPTVEYGRPNGSLKSRLSRPRDPLIEAVASHDKSNLRKVTERILPQIGPPADERNSLLEQIRAKSFNLKPAISTRPSVQGPKTNLKVVAILEKANAIRQALAGSDEDDDDDSWSDS